MITNQLAQYYAVSAPTYEEVYHDESREDDLADLADLLDELLDGHNVLELGCGTGYWTDIISEVADSVHATDFSPEMLEMAALRELDEDVVQFSLLDAYDLPDGQEGQYTAIFMAGLLTHIPRERQEKFIKQLRAKFGKDVLLVILDQAYVDGVSNPTARTDQEGNTYQIVQAADGQRYEIQTNYPTDSYLRKRLSPLAREIRTERLEHYFLLSCRLK